MQGDDVVKVANCALSFCAAWPLLRAKLLLLPVAAPELAALSPPEEAAAVVVAGGGGAAAEVAGGATAALDEAGGGGGGAAPLEPDPPEGVPGDEVISVSCVPSAMGPVGLAGHEPGGETGAVRPKGMVPGEPTARLPTKVVWLSPWNWHWKKPLSSAFWGACWQYGTACEVGCEAMKSAQCEHDLTS